MFKMQKCANVNISKVAHQKDALPNCPKCQNVQLPKRQNAKEEKTQHDEKAANATLSDCPKLENAKLPIVQQSQKDKILNLK